MKFVAIVGSNADQSYNRMLLQFMQRQFKIKCEIELLEIKDVPMFNQDDDQSDCFAIRYLNNKIIRADGVIIATPEHNHTITPALKSTLEWLSFRLHPIRLSVQMGSLLRHLSTTTPSPQPLRVLWNGCPLDCIHSKTNQL